MLRPWVQTGSLIASTTAQLLLLHADVQYCANNSSHCCCTWLAQCPYRRCRTVFTLHVAQEDPENALQGLFGKQDQMHKHLFLNKCRAPQ